MSGEKMIHCPYNYSHVILKSRMASHLIKCRQQFPLSDHATCPFNATHDVPALELKYHADTCPDRKTMETFLYVEEEEEKEEESTPVKISVHSEENWDDEKVSTSYLESKDKISEKQLLLKPLAGKSKSEKRTFLHSQEEKFRDQRNTNEEKREAGFSHLGTQGSEREPKLL